MKPISSGRPVNEKGHEDIIGCRSTFFYAGWRSQLASLMSQKLLCLFNFPVSRAESPSRKNCVIFIGCNFESRASQVGLHKQNQDIASAKKGKVSLLV